MHDGRMSTRVVQPQSTPDTDPSGIPFSEIDPAKLRERRTSVKWTRFAPDVLPLFVAEMDFAVAPVIRERLIERIENSDTGYLDGAGPLAAAFSGFAERRWGWAVPEDHVHLATDVATGVVESLRVLRPGGGRLVISTPVYPGFFEMFEELPFEIVEIPLALGDTSGLNGPAGQLDLEAIEREFASENGVDAYVLCNPHNPHGIVFTPEELRRLAELAARHDVAIVSDEIHAPLTHQGVDFVPFAPIAAEFGVLAVTTTSASKGWNLAGTKCAVIIAADGRANEYLKQLPPEVATRASILGLHSSVAAYAEAEDWLDRAIAQVEANDALLAELLAEKLPSVVHTRPRAGYLAWLDFRETPVAENPFLSLLTEARVALGDGAGFGTGGAGFVRLNLACAPHVIREAVERIARALA